MTNIDLNAILSWGAPLAISLLTSLCAYAFTFGKRANQIDNLLEDTKETKNKMQKISDDLIRLQEQVKHCLSQRRPNSFAKSHSPISLTEEGQKVSEKIKASVILANHKEELYKLINNKLDNAYDIQMDAFKVIDNNLFKILNEQELLSLKNEAFSLGKPLEDLLVIFQILFRDDILKTKNIPIAEVDKCDPNKKA